MKRAHLGRHRYRAWLIHSPSLVLPSLRARAAHASAVVPVRAVLAALLVALVVSAGAPAAAHTYYLHRANLHIHTRYSTPDWWAVTDPEVPFYGLLDHAESALPGTTFLDAKVLGLNCLGLSDHAESLGSTLLGYDAWDEEGEDARNATGGGFVGLRGFEWTGLNFEHVNVFGTTQYCGRTIWTDGYTGDNRSDLSSLEIWLTGRTEGAIAQFNHPWLGDHFNDMAAPSSASIRDAFSLMEAGGGPSPEDWLPILDWDAGYHSIWDHGDYWFQRTLQHGWHVAPTIGHDNFRAPTWNTRAHHTGVFALSSSQQDILTALRDRRTFAAEGASMWLWLQAECNGGWYLLGDTVRTGGASVTFYVTSTDSEGSFSTYLSDMQGGHVRDFPRGNVNDQHVTLSGSDILALPANPDGERPVYLVLRRDDHNMAVSAPIWLDPATSGADAAIGQRADGYIDNAFVECSTRSSSGFPGYGWAVCDNGGGLYVHEFGNGWIQDFRTPSGDLGAILRKGTASTAYFIHGAIWREFLDSGGIDTLGWPTSDEFDAAPSPYGTTGRLTRVEQGTVYWCAAYGAHRVSGNIGAQYESVGGTGSSYGFPTSDPYAWNGTVRQDFENGTYLTESDTFPGGGSAQVGELSDHGTDQSFVDCYVRNHLSAFGWAPYDNGGGEYVHRLGPGWVQDLRTPAGDHGAIMSRDGFSQAFWVQGAIWTYYADIHTIDSPLGWPDSDEQSMTSSVTGATAQYSHFQGGVLVYYTSGTCNSKSVQTSGDCFVKYNGLAMGSGPLGLPLGDPVIQNSSTGTPSWYQCFEGGKVYSWSAGRFAVYGGILSQYVAQNVHLGPLGLPTSDQYSSGDYLRQDFEGGYLLDQPDYWACASIANRYADYAGAVTVLGYAVSPAHCQYFSAVTGVDGVFQFYERGLISYLRNGDEAGNTVVTYGDNYAKYMQMGANSSPLGLPAHEEFTTSLTPWGDSSSRQCFENGVICHSAAFGAVPVYGNINEQYKALGCHTSYLGLPVADREIYANTTRQQFQGGYLYDTPTYTISVVASGAGSARVDGAEQVLPWSAGRAPGETIQLEAVAAEGYQFSGWAGDLTGAANPATVVMDADKTIRANFVPSQHTIAISVVPTVPSIRWTDSVRLSAIATDALGHNVVSWLWSDGGAGGTFFPSADAGTPTYRPPANLSAADRTVHISVTVQCDGAPPQSATVSADLMVQAVADFSDVPPAHWAFPSIESCFYTGVIEGFWNDTYHPDETVTRAAMAVYIARSLAGGDSHVPTGPAQATFPDVPNTGYGDSGTDPHWAYRYVEYAYANGVVQGYGGGSYRPEEVVNRGQMAVYIARAIGTPTGDAGVPEVPAGASPTFPDVTADNDWGWCYRYVEYCAALDIVEGYPGGAYHPEYVVSRAQMAVYVARGFRPVDVRAMVEGPPDGQLAAAIRLKFYVEGGSAMPVRTRTVTLDGTGRAITALSLPPGTYDVWGKVPTHLARRLTGWSPLSGDPPLVDIGRLLAGDLVENNAVDQADFDYLQSVWFTSDVTADITRDGIVNSLDLSILNRNWGQTGDE